MSNPILRYFTYAHLPQPLQDISRLAHDCAQEYERMLPDGPEKSAGLRKLLEAKDCFVRAALPTEGEPYIDPPGGRGSNYLTEAIKVGEDHGLHGSTPWANPEHDVLGDVIAAKEDLRLHPKGNSADAHEAINTLTDTQAQYVDRNGYCQGPTVIDQDHLGMQTAVCYLGICTWTSGPKPGGTLSMDDAIKAHHDALMPLTGLRVPR